MRCTPAFKDGAGEPGAPYRHVSLLILLSSLSEPKSTVNCKNSDCEIALITNKQLGGQFFEGASLSSKSKPKVDLSLFIS